DFTPQDVEEDEAGEPIPSVEDEDIKEDNKLKLEPGMQWKSMPGCRSYLKSLAIQDIFSFKQKQNNTKRYRIYCIGEDHVDKEMVKPCTWKVACSITRDHHTVKLRKFVGTHTCEADGKNHVKQAKAPWVAQVLEDFLRDHPNMKPLDVHKEVWRRFRVELSYYTAWKAKVKMFEKINGNYEASYLVVSELKKQIDIKNVGSLVKWYRHGETGEFVRFLLAYKASLDGFVNGCRPIIGLDGSFLKGKYGGCCLSAMALDAQNGLFPIGIALDTCTKTLRYCSPFYNVQSFKATYAGFIYHFDNEEDWDKVEIGDEVLPPPLERKSRRPRKQRIRDANEERPSKKRVCKLCHVPGHNKRTCPMREQGGTKGMPKAKKR
ncbi:hypothetical protein IFM89_002203, partial [Coptis chinensis]